MAGDEALLREYCQLWVNYTNASQLIHLMFGYMVRCVRRLRFARDRALVVKPCV